MKRKVNGSEVANTTTKKTGELEILPEHNAEISNIKNFSRRGNFYKK